MFICYASSCLISINREIEEDDKILKSDTEERSAEYARDDRSRHDAAGIPGYAAGELGEHVMVDSNNTMYLIGGIIDYEYSDNRDGRPTDSLLKKTVCL